MKTSNRESRDIDNATATVSKPEKKLIRVTSCLSWGVVAAVGLVLLILVIAPFFQESVDPNLKAPEINRFANASAGDPEVGEKKRGSITDWLVQSPDSSPEHPLDPALHVARLGLERIRADVRDYTALMVKQERVDGKLMDEEFMRVKVRHADDDGSINKAFYVRHVKPQSLAGQEAIWVENENDGKLIAHGAGIQRFFKVHLDPDGWLAKKGNRYPITELGIETLIVRMLEKGERDKKHGECEVTYDRNLEIDGHKCTLITITHPVQRDHFEYHIARIYIDDDLDLPIGYEGYIWPEQEGGEPVLLERYFYSEMKTNVGLQDSDFDPDNPGYDYP